MKELCDRDVHWIKSIAIHAHTQRTTFLREGGGERMKEEGGSERREVGGGGIERYMSYCRPLFECELKMRLYVQNVRPHRSRC